MPRALPSALVLTATLFAAPVNAATAAPTPSTVTLPIRVPLAGLARALDARAPQVIADIDQPGPLGLTLTGQIARAGALTITRDADALRVTLPVTARVRASLGGAAQQDFAGAASVTVRVTPYLHEDWTAGVRASADYTWTDPLAFEVLGARISVASLVDAQVRTQLARVTAQLEQEVARQADARARVGALWAKLAQPWRLPTPEPAFARVKPLSLSATPFTFTDDAARVTVSATFGAEAQLGTPPTTVTPTPLPSLKLAAAPRPGVHLTVPVRLPYANLSDAMTRAIQRREFRANGVLSPTVRVTRVDVTPQGARLNAAARVNVRLGPLNVNATVDVSGTPKLDAQGRVLTLADVRVRTRPDGVTQRVVGWLADARVQAFLRESARVDLAPYLDRALQDVRARLPLKPAQGITLAGRVDALRLTDLDVTPGGVVLTSRVDGDLDATVEVPGR
ncbi:DUF4403 family protein [Deinococcus maricopensis]|uniref:DUF4403 family protein n=1 Tax=Deinococcus maricopensis (strain DSM 21211 / LMG 22137 / NRRL B-23946 / LB-34) TaxID=709986 RepID=E8U6T8_DEIML|nr:DUF4403 family protein [Deinococcus maricopensis]ADV66777.1 hypothetical protein Deima_1125 [Deinococcus maricopensis DSM 21211]